MKINPIDPIYRTKKRQKNPIEIFDDLFLAWLRTQGCCICTAHPPSDAAHVRLGGRGAMGAKPLKSAVPLCRPCHAYQHQFGQTSLKPNDWWLKTADEYLAVFEGLQYPPDVV